MPETVDKSSLSTFFTAYSPQLRLFDFFSHRRVFACPALRFAFALLPRTSCPQLFFVSFLFLFCYISLPLSSSFFFSVTARLFLSRALSRILWMLTRRLSYFPPTSFPFCYRRAVPPPCFPFLPFRFAFASFCFRRILLLPLLLPLTAFCFLSHFPAAMLALSLRPAILFIYLIYHSYMNTHSLARRFLP